MRLKTFVAIVAATLIGFAGTPAWSEEGVTVKSLVTSLGGFKATVTTPLEITGATVELAPGKETGRHRFMVPTFVYIIEGILTTNTEGGPVGVAGIQYHSAGQSYMAPVGIWQDFMNKQQAPVKFLRLYIGHPGANPIETPKAE